MAACGVALLFPSASAAKKAGCNTRGCLERVAARKCSQVRPRWCVERAIVTYRLEGWRAAWMRRVPGCESEWDPLATSPGGHMGLFQFAPSTWAGLRYARESAYSAKWASLAAALMLREGRAGEWSCV